jgi:hypothetical protein
MKSLLLTAALLVALLQVNGQQPGRDSLPDYEVSVRTEFLSALLLKQPRFIQFSGSAEKQFLPNLHGYLTLDFGNYGTAHVSGSGGFVVDHKGFSVISGLKLFPFIRNPVNKGFYLSPYVRYMNLKEFRTDSFSAPPVTRGGSVVGAGLAAGARVLLFKGFFVEPVIGLAVGRSSFYVPGGLAELPQGIELSRFEIAVGWMPFSINRRAF